MSDFPDDLQQSGLVWKMDDLAAEQVRLAVARDVSRSEGSVNNAEHG